ncbi:DUF2249 domain-containing protein [Aestuariirhabdus litorea]|uniref:Sulfurtransferase TusA family protein n=1 Tax=Aestuariirhabdus litorea TaxID=2528527 RepID=A0A3P3VJY1_9GAMM|nr:DUF2249 domain-containing protein [Aestuariirhabdus litorea]RRJ83022.1 hypothetical protein D0544_14355 [Aestuariirhabdus litorea]RWW93180.1 hypothetical protein DZC74_14330 [Endozoicomonadaceae bacterium GTF-13]
MNKQPLSLEGATLPFWRYCSGEQQVIEFDSTGCECPLPMMNAMAGLERIARTGETLVMINGFEPQGLYERVRGCFAWRVEALDERRVMVVFTACDGCESHDFSDRYCKGG